VAGQVNVAASLRSGHDAVHRLQRAQTLRGMSDCRVDDQEHVVVEGPRIDPGDAVRGTHYVITLRAHWERSVV